VTVLVGYAYATAANARAAAAMASLRIVMGVSGRIFHVNDFSFVVRQSSP
jgi:hypothetical protein